MVFTSFSKKKKINITKTPGLWPDRNVGGHGFISDKNTQEKGLLSPSMAVP